MAPHDQKIRFAGRAGRFGTQWEDGYVTTFKQTDLPTLQYLLAQAPEPITKAGLHPTAEQIELYAYHLPSSTLSNLMVFTMILYNQSIYIIFLIPHSSSRTYFFR